MNTEVQPTNRHTVRQAYWLLNEHAGKFTNDLDKEFDAWLLNEKKSSQIEEVMDVSAIITSLDTMNALKNPIMEALAAADRLDHNSIATDLALSISRGFARILEARRNEIVKELKK